MNPTSETTLEYVEHRPQEALAARVRCIWALRAPADPSAGFEPVFPDGCMELVLNLADQFERASEGRIERQDRAMLVGQLLGPVRIRATGVTDIIGVRFHPWGLARADRLHPTELTGRTVPAEILGPALPRQLAPALAEISDLTARCRFLERVLASGFVPALAQQPPKALVALTQGTVRSVSLAARHAGISPRHLARLSDRWVGLPPSELVRLSRFQRALNRMRQDPTVSLARVALVSGFADQAHFTRDFGRFAGLTPSAFRRSISQLTATFISDPAAAPAWDD
jgi:AraC-like DNA-binding protein